MIGQVYGRTADIKDATIFAIAPAMIPGYGMGNALEMHTQDKAGGDLTTFFNTTQQYLAALRERPEIATASISSTRNGAWMWTQRNANGPESLRMLFYQPFPVITEGNMCRISTVSRRCIR